MNWKNILNVAMKSILRNRMRSLLTMLGIIIGVAAVIVMVAIGKGAQAQIEDQIGTLGTNVIIAFPNASRAGGVSQGAGSNGGRFTLDDVDKIEKNATLLAGVSPVIRSGVQAIGGSGNWSTSIYGVSPSYLDIRQWPLASGEFFTDREIKSRSKVCVIGKTVVDNLFPNQDPVGQEIRLRNVPFKVIGVLTQKGQNASGADQDDAVLAPSTTVLDRLSGGRFIQQLMASAASPGQMTQAQEEMRGLLRESHRLQPGEDDDFVIRNQTEIAEAAQQTTQVLTLLLASIAGVSLVVGGIGIMNIMLVSVTERTREIGIRMAIGARGSDVLTQFLVESVVLGLCGGIIGILTGVGVAQLVQAVSDLHTKIDPSIVILSFIFSGAVGVFFGFYPARKAAALNPIEALRYE
ncbi:MAG: ABC transporter permease [Candidatus Kapaibacterium sp.]